MDTIQEIKDKVYSNPQFRALPYTSQLNVYQKFLVEVLQKNENFINLNRVQQQRVFNQLAIIPPALNNQEEPWYQELVAKGEYLQKLRRDPNATPEQIDMAERSLNGFAGNQAFMREFYDTGLGKIAKKAYTTLGVSTTPGVDMDIAYSDDALKILQYYQTLQQDDPGFSSMMGTVGTFGAITGEFTGFVAMRPAIQGISNIAASAVSGAAKALNAPRWIQRAAQGIANVIQGPGTEGAKMLAANARSWAGNWVKGTLLPWLADATLDGATGLVMQELGNVAEGKGNTIFQRNFIDNLKNFGAYAAGDYAFSTVISILSPLAKLGGKILKNTFDFRGAKPAHIFKTDDEFLKVVGGLAEPNAAQLKWLEEVAPQVDDVRIHNEYVQQFEGMGEEAFRNPLMNTWLTGDRLGKVIVPDGDGFRIRTKGHLVDDVIQVKSFDELTDFIVKQYDNAPKEVIEALSQAGNKHVWIKQYSSLVNDIDMAYGAKILGKNLADDDLLKQGLKNSEYILPAGRKYIHPIELKQVANTAQETGQNIVRGDLIKSAGDSFHIKPNPEGKYVYLSKNAAKPDEYMSAMAIANRFNVDGVPVNKEAIADRIMVSKGYDTVALADGTVRPLFQSKLKQISDSVDLETGQLLKKEAVKEGLNLNESVTLSQTVKGVLPAGSLTEEGKNIVENMGNMGRLNNEPLIKAVADNYANALGKQIKTVVKPGKTVEAVLTGDTLTITAPHNLTQKSLRDEVLTSITRALDADTTPAKLSFRPQSTPVTTEVKIGQRELLTESFENIGGKVTNDGGKYVIDFKGTTRSFDDIDTAFRYFYASDLQPDALKATLEVGGYKVLTNENGTKILANNKLIIDSKKNLIDAFTEEGKGLIKIPSDYAQSFAVLDEGVNFKVTKDFVISNNKSDLLKHLDQFEDMKHLGQLEVLTTREGNTLFKGINDTYEVRSNTYGYVKKFNNARDARLFLENIDDFDNVYKMASEKNLQLSFDKHGFTIKGNGKVWTGKTMEDLQTIMAKENPTITSYPNIIRNNSVDAALGEMNIDVEFAEVVARNPEVITPSVAIPPSQYRNTLGPLQSAGAYTKQTTAFLTNAFKKTGDQQFLKYFTDFEDTRRLSSAAFNKHMDVVTSIFTDSKGKFFSLPEQRAIYYLATGADEALASGILNKVKKYITDDVRQAASRLRPYYDTIFKEIGMDGEKYLTDYLPRLYRFAYDNPDLNHMGLNKEFMEKAFKGNVPEEMKIFFENERVNDLIKGLLNDNAFEVTTIYTRKAMEKLYEEQAYKNLTTYFNNSKNLDPIITHRLVTYLDSVRGTNTSGLMKTGNTVAHRFLKKMFPKWYNANKDYASDFVNGLFSYNYACSMGLKPFLGLRNMMQPYHTFAPRFGINVVNEAYQAVMKDGDNIIKRLIDDGIIYKNDPVMTELSGGFMGRMAHKAMKGYTTSDQITRAIAYKATEIRFMDGIDKLKRNIFNLDEFEKYVGLNLIDNDAVKKTVLNLVQENEIKPALDRYAVETIQETMFPYRPSERPLFGGNSVLGKLFWQYGTYSSGYVSNFLRGFKNGSTAQKIAYVGRLAAVSGIIGGILSEMGIDNKNFIPWTPMLFSGGPFIDTSYDIIKSLGSGYEADAARNRLKSLIIPHKNENGDIIFGELFPLSYQIKNIQRGLRALDNNDSLSAFYFFTSTPQSPEHAQNYW